MGSSPWRDEKVYRTRDQVRPFVQRLTLEMPASAEWLLGGSWRRGAEKIGDLDVMLVTPTGTFDGFAFPASFIPQKAGGRVAEGDLVVHGEKIHLDLWVCTPRERGALLLFITGPKDLNIGQRAQAAKMGWTLSQYGLFAADGMQLDNGTEEDIYRRLGFPWIPPEDRQRYAAMIPDRAKGVQVFEVESETTAGKIYRVRCNGGVWSCNCPGYRFYGSKMVRPGPRTCKHIDRAKEKVLQP